MNKKLVAVAVAGMLAVPLVAHAQTANVTLYGRVDIAMEVINAKQDQPLSGNPRENMFMVRSNNSRLGVRGAEALGDGLSAIFQIESNASGTNGGGGFATLGGHRETFVGLQGGWGTLRMGYFFTPYDDIHPIFGNVPTLTGSILSTRALWSNSGWVGNSLAAGAFDDPAANSIRYDSPNIAGLTGSVQLASGTQGGDAFRSNTATPTTLEAQRKHAYMLSLNGLYYAGPFQGGIAYEFHNNFRPQTVATFSKLQDQAFSVAGAWNFGVARVGAVFERVKYDVNTGGTLQRNFWGGSLTWDLGPGQLYAMVGQAQNGSGSAAQGSQIGAVRKGANTGAAQYEVSYTYALSKRTLIYAGYVQIANRSNGANNFGINVVGGMCGLSTSGQVAGGCGNSAKPQGIIVSLVNFF